MSFQILDIALWNSNGEQRVVSFSPGRVNVVTGGSNRGKSSLVYIVDYCLGRNDFLIPKGVIVDSVQWYGLRLKTQQGIIFVARPRPPLGQKTGSEAYISAAGNEELPSFAELKPNTNLAGLTSFLTDAVGIPTYEHVPPEGQTRSPVKASIDHTVFHLFQPQNRVADHTLLFYRQEEPFLPQTIKDTLPFFLGAVKDDHFQRLQSLRRARRELKLLLKKAEAEEAIRGHSYSRAAALYAEAQQIGLMSDDFSMPASEELIEPLRSCLSWSPTTSSVAESDTLAQLNQEKESFHQKAKQLKRELTTAKAFASTQAGFSKEISEQQFRLEAIDLFAENDGDAHRCPLCSSGLESPQPSTSNIIKSLEQLKSQMSAVGRQRPRLEEYIQGKEDALADVRQRLSENRAAIESIVSQEDVLQQLRDHEMQQARVVGRISLFLDSVDFGNREDVLEPRIEAAKAKVEELELGVSEEDVEQRLEASLRHIGNNITEWAGQLKLEHSSNPIGLDAKDLTVVAYREDEQITLQEMGPGEKAMGYHVTAMLALHDWFMRKNRPVPRFLMLDQITQVYFPPDPRDDFAIEDLNNEDRNKVENLFKFIFDYVEKRSPEFQVVLTEHANLSAEWFQSAVVANWWGDEKLIPKSWY